MLEVVVFMRYLDFAINPRLSGRHHLVWGAFSPRPDHPPDYFLGGRTAPWWAISLSIVSAETAL